MKVSIVGSACYVERENGDPVFRNGGYAGGNAGESRLLYHVKSILNARGYNLVKTRMWKDGHLMGGTQQYLRPPLRPKNPPGPHIYVFNGRWAIAGAEEDFNEFGKVELYVEYDVFSMQPGCAEMVRRLEEECSTTKQNPPAD